MLAYNNYMPLIASINISQFLANIKAIKQKVRTNIIAVVKADAYGHGAAALSKYSQDFVDAFAVADIIEANELAESGIVKPIHILSPISCSADKNLFLDNFIPTICSLRDIECIKKLKKPLSYGVALELNTGMNRLGLNQNELPIAITRLKQFNIKVQSIFSHLYNASNLNDCQKQLNKFSSFTKDVPPQIPLHIAASSCTNLPNTFYFDAVRLGIGLYGYANDTTPILKIHSDILKIFAVKKGENISYGEYTAPRDMLIAAVRAGYADGIKRKIEPETENRFMSINGKLCPIIGQVCMDITMIDVTNANVSYIDPVYILGEGVTANMLACDQITNVYEILTNFKGRVRREYVR